VYLLAKQSVTQSTSLHTLETFDSINMTGFAPQFQS